MLAPSAARTRQFPLTPHRSGQNQVRDVRAGDDEDEAGGRQQNQQDGRRGRDDLVPQAPGLDAEVGLRLVGLGVRLDHGAVHDAKLGERRVEVGTRREPAEELRHAVDASLDHRRIEMMRAGDDVGDDLGLLRIRHRRFEDADNGGGPIAQPDDLADHARIALERARPEAIGEHGRAFGVPAIVSRTEEAAHHRTKPHHVEVGASNHARANRPRLAETDHREFDGREVAECAERLHACLEVLDLRDREVRIRHADAGGALTDVDEAIGIAVHEGPQQDAANDAEDRGVGADAERQRQDDGESKARGPRQGAKGEFEVGHQAHWPLATNVAMASSNKVVAAELISPRIRWKTVADAVTIIIPAAAHVTSHGMIRVSPGRVNPTAASTSATPRKS